ncbi:hypothetical protein M1513_01245, partial [Patescibacteria group bacterium]|nr:hypothetical protein [Patescibacteria group bacterium]
KISSPSLMLELTLFRLINIPSKHNVTELINKIDKFISLKTNQVENPKMEDKTGKFNLNDDALTPPPPAFDSSFALRQPLPKTAAPAPANAQTDRQVKIAPNDGNNTHGGSDEFFAHFDKIDEKLARENGKQEPNALIDDGIKADEAEKPEESIIMESIKDIFGKDIERIDKTKK